MYGKCCIATFNQVHVLACSRMVSIPWYPGWSCDTPLANISLYFLDWRCKGLYSSHLSQDCLIWDVMKPFGPRGWENKYFVARTCFPFSSLHVSCRAWLFLMCLGAEYCATIKRLVVWSSVSVGACCVKASLSADSAVAACTKVSVAKGLSCSLCFHST